MVNRRSKFLTARVVLSAALLLTFGTALFAQIPASGSITANGASVSAVIGRSDVATIAFQVSSGWTGTVTFEGSFDGLTFVSVLATNATSGAKGVSTTASGIFSFPNVGYHTVRARATAAWTGTALVNIRQGFSADGGAATGGGGSGDASAANQTTQIAHEAAIEAATEAIQAQAAAAALEDVGDGDSDANKKPVLMGARGVALRSNPTPVDADDRARLTTTRARQLFTIGGHPNVKTRTCTVLDADGAQTGTACVTVSAGSLIVVTRATATCSKANTVNVAVRVVFDADATFPAASTTGTDGEILSNLGVEPGSGATVGDGGGILGIGADDEDVRFTMADPVSGGCAVTISYFTIEG